MDTWRLDSKAYNTISVESASITLFTHYRNLLIGSRDNPTIMIFKSITVIIFVLEQVPKYCGRPTPFTVINGSVISGKTLYIKIEGLIMRTDITLPKTRFSQSNALLATWSIFLLLRKDGIDLCCHYFVLLKMLPVK